MQNLDRLIATLNSLDSGAPPIDAELARAGLAQLPDLDQAVIKARFGLTGEKRKLLSDLAATTGLTVNRVRLVEARALRRLLHQSRS